MRRHLLRDVDGLTTVVGVVSLASIVVSVPLTMAAERGHAPAVAGVAVAVAAWAVAVDWVRPVRVAGRFRARTILDLLTDRLTTTEAMLETRDQRHEELVHDARSTTAALRMASVAMMNLGGDLTGEEQERLAEAILVEIGHLEHLIDRPRNPVSLDFDVEDVIRPVVELQRANGMDVRLLVAGVRARGCPADVATVVRNLLVNARVHAGDGAVVIRAVDAEDGTQIYVEDRGPGITTLSGDPALSRGSARAGSPGSGLGLHICRTLMHEQGGELEIVQRSGPGAVLLLRLLPPERNESPGALDDDAMSPVGPPAASCRESAA